MKQHVYPMRQRTRREAYRVYWWRHVEPRQGMWRALAGLPRYIATPTVSKHRLFVWLDARICPDHQLIVIARADDTTFGVLHSRFHEAWSLRLGTWLGKGNDPRYTPTTTFESFPFPEGLSPDVPAATYATDPRAVVIGDAAKRLVELRERWLNPPEWVEWTEEPVPGFPQRPVAVDEAASAQLQETNPHQPLQRPSSVDRRRSRCPRRRRGIGLWLVCRHRSRGRLERTAQDQSDLVEVKKQGGCFRSNLFRMRSGLECRSWHSVFGHLERSHVARLAAELHADQMDRLTAAPVTWPRNPAPATAPAPIPAAPDLPP